MRRVWKRWLVFTHYLGNFQARVFLTVFYGIGVAPLAIAVRLLADPLRMKTGNTATWWVDRAQPDPPTLERSKRQY